MLFCALTWERAAAAKSMCSCASWVVSAPPAPPDTYAAPSLTSCTDPCVRAWVRHRVSSLSSHAISSAKAKAPVPHYREQHTWMQRLTRARAIDKADCISPKDFIRFAVSGDSPPPPPPPHAAVVGTDPLYRGCCGAAVRICRSRSTACESNCAAASLPK